MYRGHVYTNGFMMEIITKLDVPLFEKPPFQVTLTNFKLIKTNRLKLVFSEENNSEMAIYATELLDEKDMEIINSGNFQFIE